MEYRKFAVVCQIEFICRCHNCSGTLDIADVKGGGEIAVRDIDWVIVEWRGKIQWWIVMVLKT